MGSPRYKCAFPYNPAALNYSNRHNSAADSLLLLKLTRCDDTNVRPRTSDSVNFKTGRRIPPSGSVFSNSVLGTSSPPIKIFLPQISVCGVPQRVEWSKYAFLENQRWRTTAKSNKLNRYNSDADCPISFKFCTMTYVAR